MERAREGKREMSSMGKKKGSRKGGEDGTEKTDNRDPQAENSRTQTENTVEAVFCSPFKVLVLIST